MSQGPSKPDIGALEATIVEKARGFGASAAGIARVADLKAAPSYAAYEEDPYDPAHAGVEWRDEHRSVLVWALAHPATIASDWPVG